MRPASIKWSTPVDSSTRNPIRLDLPALSGPPAMRESGGYDRPDAAVGA